MRRPQISTEPVLVDLDGAIAIVAGKGKILEFLENEGLVTRQTDSHKCVTFDVTDLKDAYRNAKLSGELAKQFPRKS